MKPADTGGSPSPLEAAALELAGLHGATVDDPGHLPVRTGVEPMKRWLKRALKAAAEPPPESTKAAEWLLDNTFHLQKAIRLADKDMPAGFYRRLPGLRIAADSPLPRIFCVAHGLLHASRLQLTSYSVVRYLEAYQQREPLSIAELWALPTMLRLACLEILVCAFSRLFPDIKPPFRPTSLASLEEAFDDTECTARAIANLAVISSIGWRDVFDAVSLVERELRKDPAFFYGQMDFETRDSCRKAVERLAIGADHSELEVARTAIERATAEPPDGASHHVGHWLISAGYRDLAAQLGYRPGPLETLCGMADRRAGWLYATALIVATLAALVIPATYLANLEVGWPIWALGFLLLLTPASILAITLVNWVVTLTVSPRVLPKLDFRKGIPEDCATVVVMPVLVSRSSEVGELLERMEAHRITNPDPSLQFVLLTDGPDAPQERVPDDREIETALVDGIGRLNLRYGSETGGPFHLFHRGRRYNTQQGCWMGWERKRGKLEQFNSFLLGDEVPDYVIREGETARLRGIRFVVTLDADTRLQHETVQRLVGTLAHPLNKARFSAETGHVVAGYTVLQPRVEATPESSGRSMFARYYTGDTAIDIYSRAVSDVYQDLFGSGIFAGKGIYEVETFHRSLEGRIEENTVLSHDLLEGALGRAGLISDIVLYETFPSGYLEHMRRWHRWVRGDWQLLPRLLGPSRSDARNGTARGLPILERWKMLDNLRRSLLPVSLVALALAAWLVLPGNPWVWTLLTVLAPAAYIFTDIVSGLAKGRRRGAVRGVLHRTRDHAGRWLLAIVFLAQDAVVAVDAVGRTLWRTYVSRRNLLEWRTAAHVAMQVGRMEGSAANWRQMLVSPAFAILAGIAVVVFNPSAIGAALPLLLLWLLAPEIAAFIGQPWKKRTPPLDEEAQSYLRLLARRTWLYFETYAGPEDHWLPPDNVQEPPHVEIAHRTSPTNVGMMFLSSLSAWDLGYLGSAELAVRAENALDTLDQLERHRGHMLNWYDTRTLEPLEPRYVSTVDSGNLAGCLLVLKEGCLEAATRSLIGNNQWNGLLDELALLEDEVSFILDKSDGALTTAISSMRARIVAASATSNDLLFPLVRGLLEEELPQIRRALQDTFGALDLSQTEELREAHVWLERLRHHLFAWLRDLRRFRPWEEALGQAPPQAASLAARVTAILTDPGSVDECVAKCDEARLLLSTRELGGDAEHWRRTMLDAVARGAEAQQETLQLLLRVAERASSAVWAMEFGFLFDPETRLFYIGYNLSADRIDPHRYDLLATEARLASYIAIAKGDVPVEHWFFLGRPVAATRDGAVLLSWNGSMFEYLMPTLLMRSDGGTLLGRSELGAVEVQRRHGKDFGAPWGISESGFSARDPEHRYRYRAFGVPDLGLRRGLARDLVIAPYASALALAVSPEPALDNLRQLARLGALGRYGLREALDFTPERVDPGRRFTPVRSYMAHHQGMLLAALGNALCDNVHVRRFHAEPRMRSAELLLHERIPWEVTPESRPPVETERLVPARRKLPSLSAWEPADSAIGPQLHMLGNGRLASWISEAGGGGLWWHGHALTRWLPDGTTDAYGQWIYMRDEETGELWSIGRQPTAVEPDEWRVVYHPHLAEFHRLDHGISIHMEIAVAAGDDLEMRRITIVNRTGQARSLRLTSLCEVALARPLDDERHPAFSKLFVGGEWLPEMNGLLFARRPKRPTEGPPVMLQRLVTDDPGVNIGSFCCDRRSVLGRNGSIRAPEGSMTSLAGKTGWTLDSVAALQCELDLEPYGNRQLALVTVAGGSRESVMEIAERYATMDSLEWVLADAASAARHEAHDLRIDTERLPEFQMLASLLACPGGALSGEPSARDRNVFGQPNLWGLGLSGDLPILLVRLSDSADVELVRLLLQAQRYWLRREMKADVVILRTGSSGYEEPLRDQVAALLREYGLTEFLKRKGGIHLLFADHLSHQDVQLLEATARVILDTASGNLKEQLASARKHRATGPAFLPSGRPVDSRPPAVLERPADLVFDNGLGGFTPDGEEYVIHLEPGDTTPAPWSNVLANDGFGTLVTESGLGFTWAVNSGENRLTPWCNDAVLDTPGEVIYLRDEETGEVWTPTPRPTPDDTACQIRHGAGYTKWLKKSNGLDQELLAFVPPDAPVKIVRLRLCNRLDQPRRVTATYYAEWLLGALGSVARPAVVTRYDPHIRTLLARNPWNPEFADAAAFLTSNLEPHSISNDRTAFLGQEGVHARPDALQRWDLGGESPNVADPCAALQIHLDLTAGGECEVYFVLGQGKNEEATRELVNRWRQPDEAARALDATRDYWNRQLGTTKVETPDRGFDFMVNRWLPYQALASRIMARAGFYQAGGAFGFRDQLQDVMMLFMSDPQRARGHILACAARQFEEGDVMHWWHPPSDRGVRTRCSDDLLWLPYVTSRYVEATGDVGILEQEVPFLIAPPLADEEEDRYARFSAAPESHSLLEHCGRALEKGVTRGRHGLPLIGAGDWNDGMDRIGHRMKGESVWLAWFAIAAMEGFAGLCARTGREEEVQRWTGEARRLASDVEQAAWDGAWYLRAFDDDGRPWGSSGNDECRIDVIAQAWSVMSCRAEDERARQAVSSAVDALMRDDDGIIRLLWPPFDLSPRDPGYIKAYPPGIRENGGQYTHGASWLGFALAALGDGDKALRVFDMLCPLGRTGSRQELDRYLVEPYVVAADIAGAEPHVGRGGWTWYTGSAAWAWRLGTEAILGLSLDGGKLRLNPCLPRHWPGFKAEIAANGARLSIRVENPHGLSRGELDVTVDGRSLDEALVPFPEDNSTRDVVVKLRRG